MAAALKLAERGLFTVTRGNPRVGCLLVKDRHVVGRGWHQRDGEPHAEANALAEAGESARGCTAYVSLEPCCFEGRTKACTDILADHGVRRVVIGARDHHPQVQGKGIERLRELGLEVKVMGLPVPGDLNPGTYTRHRRNMPYVRIKIAMSMDGRTALASGASQWITSAEARRDGQYWRARSGAIITGIGTIVADDPHLTVREPEFKGNDPWRVVLDNRARFPASAVMLNDTARIIVVCAKDASIEKLPAKVDVWQQETATIQMESVLRQLAAEGVNELLVEAGSWVVKSLVEARLWHEMIVYISPKFMGRDARPIAEIQIEQMADVVPGQIIATKRIGPDVRLTLRPLAPNSS